MSTVCWKHLDVERAVRPAELHQVQRGQVARRVVDVHVLRARVGRVDAARVRRRVPLVDRRVVLDARIGAAPGRLGDLAHQLARLDRLADRLAGGARDQVPVGVVLDGVHELVRDAERSCWRSGTGSSGSRRRRSTCRSRRRAARRPCPLPWPCTR